MQLPSRDMMVVVYPCGIMSAIIARTRAGNGDIKKAATVIKI